MQVYVRRDKTIIVNRVFHVFISRTFISATRLAKLGILNFGWPLKKGKDDRK